MWGDNLPVALFGPGETAAVPQGRPRSGPVSWRYWRAWRRAAHERFGTKPETLELFLQSRSQAEQAKRELGTKQTGQTRFR